MTASYNRYNRRQFLVTGTRAAGVTVGAVAGVPTLSRPLLVMVGGRPEPIPSIQDPRVKALAHRAIQAAREAGAAYADVRLTYTRLRHGSTNLGGQMIENEALHVGVRALIDGYWGFAASPVWHPDEMARLGREAAQQARVNALGKPREVYRPSIQPVVDGHWETPIRIDPFALHPQEIHDFFLGVQARLRNDFARRTRLGIFEEDQAQANGLFWVQEKAFASTDGTYCTQRLHRTKAVASYKPGSTGTLMDFAGAGWEYIKDAPIIETVRQSIDAYLRQPKLPVKPIDVGRYNTVFDTSSVAELLSRTIGAATELDRAMGYEANAGGTSYLSDPEEMLGTFPVGSHHLTVTANRSETRGLATTRWDDEGVEPHDITLIKDGILHDFQTSREGAGWLRDAYARAGRPFISHGCMVGATGADVPLIHTANLVMQPGQEDTTQQDLEAALGNGMSVVGLAPQIDFQCLNGMSNRFACYEIKRGKRVAVIAGAGILFRTPELWKSVSTIGGARSARWYGLGSEHDIIKGEPEQYGAHTVTTVPITAKDITFINAAHR